MDDGLFDDIRRRHGADATARIEQMLSPRFRRSLPPMQRRARYVVPGLSKGPFRDLADLPAIRAVADRLEALHPRIRDEIAAVLDAGAGVDPYAHYDLGDFDRTQWSSVYLFRDGREVEASARLCPVTAAFMRAELADLLCPLQEMHFSVVMPGTHIAPHADMGNFTVNLHLGVEVPGGCRLRVGDETRTWTEGRCLAFDDSYEHEVWNDGPRRRVCLLMDLWHPDLSAAEREALTLLVETLTRDTTV